MTMTMDDLDKLGASAFQGYLVRKDLVRKYSRQYPVPTYVVEFLLGRYCATIDEKEIEVNGTKISPLKFSSKILFRDWKLGEEEEELTVMKIVIEGEKNGSPKRVQYNLLDHYDTKTKTTSPKRFKDLYGALAEFGPVPDSVLDEMKHLWDEGADEQLQIISGE